MTDKLRDALEVIQKQITLFHGKTFSDTSEGDHDSDSLIRYINLVATESLLELRQEPSEKVVEAVARAIWESPYRGHSGIEWKEIVSAASDPEALGSRFSLERTRNQAKAAIAAIRKVEGGRE